MGSAPPSMTNSLSSSSPAAGGRSPEIARMKLPPSESSFSSRALVPSLLLSACWSVLLAPDHITRRAMHKRQQQPQTETRTTRTVVRRDHPLEGGGGFSWLACPWTPAIFTGTPAAWKALVKFSLIFSKSMSSASPVVCALKGMVTSTSFSRRSGAAGPARSRRCAPVGCPWLNLVPQRPSSFSMTPMTKSGLSSMKARGSPSKSSGTSIWTFISPNTSLFVSPSFPLSFNLLSQRCLRTKSSAGTC
mmetsp:Transcript_39152/g.110676  ORF Transcript_39152/g.110676 Transcript_39152/m.110676 type:complete len:247 (-) Transcript_39152:1159-1899(-)